MFERSALWMGISVTAGLIAGCNGASDRDPTTFATLSTALVSDSSASSTIQKVQVTLVKVTAHSETAGWVTLSTQKQTVDLMRLPLEGLPLGKVKLPAGKITQYRLYTAPNGPHSVVLKSGQSVELTIPSGATSGIEVKGPFEVGHCQTAQVPVQVDAAASVHVQPKGNGQQWLLRPVIRLGKPDLTDYACPEHADPPPVDTSNDAAFSPCTLGTSCLSGICSSGTCEPSGPGGACRGDSDCASGGCSNGSCGLTATTGHAGDACTQAVECASNSCVDSVCDVGASGSACGRDTDCAEGFGCSAGSCAPTVN